MKLQLHGALSKIFARFGYVLHKFAVYLAEFYLPSGARGWHSLFAVTALTFSSVSDKESKNYKIITQREDLG